MLLCLGCYNGTSIEKRVAVPIIALSYILDKGCMCVDEQVKEWRLLLMNRGGFSWKTLLGITGLKRKIARKTGVPMTKSGIERKVGAAVINGIKSIIKK